MKDLSLFFSNLDNEPYKIIFSGIDQVWEPLKKLDTILQSLIQYKFNQNPCASTLKGVLFDRSENSILGQEWIKLDQSVYLKEQDVFIGKGTLLEPSVIIKGPAVIGENCDIRQGAYIRGQVFVGEGCIIGHATEVKNSILMDHCEAGHFNYIGESILGRHVNMGAGSRLANLQFRGKDEKLKSFINPIKLSLQSKEINTGMEKLGAIVGDYAELGCNAVLCPGSLIGSGVWVYPNLMVPKGYYPPNMVLAPGDRKPRIFKK